MVTHSGNWIIFLLTKTQFETAEKVLYPVEKEGLR
jgi:hypothetical protein